MAVLPKIIHWSFNGFSSYTRPDALSNTSSNASGAEARSYSLSSSFSSVYYSVPTGKQARVYVDRNQWFRGTIGRHSNTSTWAGEMEYYYLQNVSLNIGGLYNLSQVYNSSGTSYSSSAGSPFTFNISAFAEGNGLISFQNALDRDFTYNYGETFTGYPFRLFEGDSIWLSGSLSISFRTSVSFTCWSYSDRSIFQDWSGNNDSFYARGAQFYRGIGPQWDVTLLVIEDDA